jgi:hypothetical protein
MCEVLTEHCRNRIASVRGFMELKLTDAEHQLLLEILEERHRRILREIWHTDHREFKEKLRQDERLIEAMLNRLEQTPAQAVHG